MAGYIIYATKMVEFWMNREESAKGSKWPAEVLNYTWGFTRGSVHTMISQD